MPPTSTMVEVGPGLRLHLRVREGRGERPFLLVHGLASNALLWEGVGEALASAGHAVVAVDQRGHGRSDAGDGDLSFAAVGRDLAAVADALELRRPVLVGQSWGGNVVLETAAAHPERFGAVGAVDGGFIALGRAHDSPDEAWTSLRPPPIAGRSAAAMRRVMATSMEGWPDGAVDAQWGNLREREDGTVEPRLALAHHEQIIRHMWATDPFASMTRVTAPVLLLPVRGGDGEWAARKQAGIDEALRALPDGRVVWLDGHHDVHLQKPDEVAGHLRGLAALVGE